MLDKADGSIYNEGTANTDKLFAAGRRWNGRSSAGQASCLPEKGPVLHGRTAGPEGMGMKQNRPCRLVCVLCVLAFALTALPMAAFAQQPEETAAVQQSLTAADVRGMQQADAAVTELTDSEDYTRMSEDERIEAALQQLEAINQDTLSDDAKTLYSSVFSEVGVTAVKDLYKTGYDAYQKGDYATAIEDLGKCYELDNTQGDALYFLARSYHKSGDTENAKTYYQKVVDEFPNTKKATDAAGLMTGL